MLESLPVPPGAIVYREYERGSGYGYDFAIDAKAGEGGAPTIALRERLKADGWQTLQEHAALSAYARDGLRLTVLRYGPELPQDLEGRRVIKTAKLAGGNYYFWAVEVGKVGS